MPLHLDTRKRIIINALLRSDDFLSSRELSEITGVSSRTVRTDLGRIADELRKLGFPLQASPGMGFLIPEKNKKAVRNIIVSDSDYRPVTPEDRMYYLVGKLLRSPVQVSGLTDELCISESTLEKDFERCGQWFSGYGAGLQRLNNVLRLDCRGIACESLFVPFYIELSRHTGVKPGLLLSEDYPGFSSVNSALKSFIGKFNLRLSDENYLISMIIILVIIDCAGSGDVPDQGFASADNHAGALIGIFAESDIRLSRAAASRIIAQLEKTGCFSRPGPLADDISKNLTRLLRQYQYPPADALLNEGLAECINSFRGRSYQYIEPQVSLRELEIKYPDALGLSVSLLEGLGDYPERPPFDSEIISTGLCFAAFFERNILNDRKRVSVICPDDLGAAQLIQVRLSRMFPNLEILGPYPEYGLDEAESCSPDFIISTADIDSDYDVVKISNFISDLDFDNIIPFLRKDSRGRALFRRLVSEKLFFADLEPEPPEQIIRRLCVSAFGPDCEGFIEGVLEREALGSTAVGNLSAIPHAVRSESGENCIVVGILNSPVKWGNENVQIIFLLRLDEPEDDTAALFAYLYDFINNRNQMKRLIEEKQYALLMNGQEGEE